MSERIELGAVVRETVTGFQGTVVARTEWMTGCRTYAMQGALDKDGKIPDQQWMDEIRLRVVTAPAVPEIEPFKGGPVERPRSTTNVAA